MVLHQLIEASLQTVVKCNPWFLDKDSFDLEIWHQVKNKMLNESPDREKNIPIDFWPIWALIKAVILQFQGKF